jgi:hypothetical protein
MAAEVPDMTTISVGPNPVGGGPAYLAVAGGEEATGAAPGEALDALLARTGRPSGLAVVILQPDGPDEFFPADKRDRLAELMAKWRAARDSGATLDPSEQTELDGLIADEFRASAARCAALLGAARP